MEESEDTPQLIAAPRHLRRRVFHPEIPDNLLVSGLDPLPQQAPRALQPERQGGVASARVRAFGRKRAVALLVVIFVTISIPVLVLALIFAG
ncbi:hypothetical protein M1E17_14570 [Arthrobacter sp. D1-29]